MSDERRAATAPPSPVRRRAPWHLVYFALAAFDLLAVATGLHLSHRLMQIYTGSVTENQLWAQRLAAFYQLNDLAAAANAPGNDVFDTRDVASERAKRDGALAVFRTHLQGVTRDIETSADPSLRSQLVAAIADVQRAMDAMVELADLVFSLFAADQANRAGEHMATMDRRYGDVTRLVSVAAAEIQTIQSELFRAQLADAQRLKQYEYAIGLLIVLMVAGVTLYGHRIRKVMAADDQAIEQARAAATLNETRFRDFAESASDWYWETDTEHRFTFISPGAGRFFDVAARIGRSRLEVSAETPEMATQMDRHQADLAAGLPFRDFEFESRLPGERGRIFLVSGNPVRGPDGTLVGYRGIGREISAVHAANRRLAEALEREREAVAHQRRFISIAAHEFRTPLTIIDGAAQRLLRNVDRVVPDDLRSRVARIRQAVARLAEIVDRTLSAARIDEGRIEIRRARIDITQLLIDICRRHESVSPGFTIAVTSAAPGLEVDADRQLLDQVFTNLLSNAVKYSSTSRRIDVEIASTPEGARVEVRDYGVGIPADELPQLFTRFYRATTGKSVSGTGIGLSVVKELLALHGGSISVASQPGVETSFTVFLPTHQASDDVARGEAAA